MLKYFMTVDTLTPIEQMIIDRFISLSTKMLDIEAIYLFGSRARAEGHVESDIDIAVIIKNQNIETLKELNQRAIDLSIKVEEELNVSGELMLTPIIIEESLLKTNIGIGKTINEEGILLWSRKSAGQKRKVI